MVRTVRQFEKDELREALHKVAERTRREIEAGKREDEDREEQGEGWRDQDTDELLIPLPRTDDTPGHDSPRDQRPGDRTPELPDEHEPSDLKCERVQ